jgi:hypothetical protein
MLLMSRIIDRLKQCLVSPDNSAVFGRACAFATYAQRVVERPLSGKADIQVTAQNLQKIDQIGAFALPSETGN